ncbi:MAG: AAA family ATPase [Xanthomonadaceae bacterium]|nr:AAA family ATPase [Xanthomonadaceae bacterium]
MDVTVAIFILGLFIGIGLALWLRRPGAPAPTSVQSPALPATGDAHDDNETKPEPSTASTEADGSATAPVEETPADRLYRLRREIEAEDERIQRPEDLQRLAQFREAAALLASDAFSPKDILEQLESDHYVLQCLVYAALRERSDISPTAALAVTEDPGRYTARFMLDYLQSREDAAALPAFLRHVRQWWWDNPPLRQRVREYLQWAESHAPGTDPMPLDALKEYELEQLHEGLKSLQLPMLAPYLAQVEAEQAKRREQRTLGGVGRLWSPAGDDARSGIVGYPDLDTQVERLHDMLHATPSVSILVSGEHGSGKTTLVDRLLARLHGEGWLLFDASAAEVLSGQKYIGELEERIGEMLAALNRPRALWRVQDFLDLLQKGSHSQDPRGILDMLLPAIERGQLRMIGELQPAQLAQLLIARPTLRHLTKTITLQPPTDTTLRTLLARWREVRSTSQGRDVVDARALDEARRMAAQYFPEQHDPGRTLRLLEDTLQAAIATEPHALPITPDALLQTIARRSGLPLDVIDDSKSLDLDALRAFFRKRVIGQDEAVECLVDRIAMLKAGLVDTARPVGVFLFAGPTGTGKTELAKALGELLFGSGDRLLRLDMSEYQSDDSAWRLTDVSRDGSTRSLVSRIREQPFSVVLLDEFEKAHPKVWDLFLQVFDDGRLSDRNGNVADFRHSIVILTSNAGSTLGRSAGPGFTSVAGGYSRGTVEKALFETFRREFLNRLDRIVLFKPLDRSLMREILHKELQRAMGRRGLRNRDWAVEWEPSAIEFLLDRGFTPDLGARPLRRAIEQHLLAPLARSIVEHRTPQGDQFLFVRSAGERLDVEFIDPNAPSGTTDIVDTTPAAAGDLRTLLWSPDASRASLDTLHATLDALLDTIDGDAWREARDRDFTAMNASDFWSRPERFDALDRIERRNRIESALDTVQRLDERLARDGGNATFVARTAQTLWLTGLAIDALAEGRPQDALLVLSASDTELRRDPARTRLWWQQLLAMYMAWAERRNMRVDVIEQNADACRARLAISGFGACDLLLAEHGLHVFEHDADDNAPRRSTVAVRVAADLPGRARIDLIKSDDELRVCRRYRAEPSPLVRDSVRAWRTGRLDRVLAGEFDVIVGE